MGFNSAFKGLTVVVVRSKSGVGGWEEGDNANNIGIGRLYRGPSTEGKSLVVLQVNP